MMQHIVRNTIESHPENMGEIPEVGYISITSNISRLHTFRSALARLMLVVKTAGDG